MLLDQELIYFYRANEQVVLAGMTWCMLICGILVFLVLTQTSLRAAYGRYSADAPWFITFRVDARLAWFLQEVPAFLVPVLLVLTTWNGAVSAPFIAICCFIVHYAQRSLVYPWLIRGGKPTPIHTFLLALIFCAYNGFLQGRANLIANEAAFGWSWSSKDLAGLLTFLCGMAINIHSDSVLRNLRRPGEVGYKIPLGGMYRWVSCANFFGEIVEWTGYALIANSFPAWTFAAFTALNLVPRALHHHKWYLEKFDEYPRERKAVIPFLI